MAHLTAIGIDRWGVADASVAPGVVPGSTTVLVGGSGGRALWDHFTAAVRREPSLVDAEHPLDAYVAGHLAPLPQPPGGAWVRCASDVPVTVDFRVLAQAAGLGWSSRIGLLVNPEVGPWLALRVAAFTADALPVSGLLPSPGPCPSCPAPCEAACPVGAVSSAGLDVAASWAFRQQDARCDGGCHARSACPVGAEHRYGAAQHRYHQHGAGRRASLRALLADREEP